MIFGLGTNETYSLRQSCTTLIINSLKLLYATNFKIILLMIATVALKYTNDISFFKKETTVIAFSTVNYGSGIRDLIKL